MNKIPTLKIAGLSFLSLLTFGSAFGQGKEVARDLRSYIEAPASKSYEAYDATYYSPTASPGIEPKPHDRDPVIFKPEEQFAINGQVVDETNNVVYKAFESHPEWKNVVVVSDWTGSMYPYAGQVMRWHKLNMDKQVVKHMVFFNDGDDKTRGSQPKVVGKTGGLYYPDPNDLDDFLAKVEIAIDNGDGGESEENDLEAVLDAVTRYDDGGEIVLVADNSGVRDMELLIKINKPVHVILVNGGWVKDYVEIAYRTGGSITTMGESVDFSKPGVGEGGVVALNGLKYKFY